MFPGAVAHSSCGSLEVVEHNTNVPALSWADKKVAFVWPSARRRGNFGRISACRPRSL